MTKIVTFYSFKGGVGRTMALVNTAYVLARDGWRVLLVDLDLEAPGMTHFLATKLSGPVRVISRDVIDLLLEVKKSFSVTTQLATVDLSPYVINIPLPPKWQEQSRSRSAYRQGRIDLIPAALEATDESESRDYLNRIGELDLSWIFSTEGPGHEFGRRLRSYFMKARFDAPGDSLFTLRDPVKSSYDIVLLDSRTGLNEIAGLCIGPVSDALVICMGLNAQNLAGTKYFAKRAGLLKKDAKSFVVVASPVPVWHSSRSALQIDEIAKHLGIRSDDIVEIPYHPTASLEETVFVVQEPRELISRAYEHLAPRLTNDISGERAQMLLLRRLDELTIHGNDQRVALEVAQSLAALRLQDRIVNVHFDALTFPTGVTMIALPRRRGRLTFAEAARIALASAIAALSTRGVASFRRAADFLDVCEPEVCHDFLFRLLFYQVRTVGRLPPKGQLSRTLDAIEVVLKAGREGVTYFGDPTVVVRLDAVVAGQLLRGEGIEDPRLPNDAAVRSALLPVFEAYLPYGTARSVFIGQRPHVSGRVAFEQYATFFLHLFKRGLERSDRVPVRDALERFRVPVTSIRRPTQSDTEMPVILDRAREFERRAELVPLGFSLETMMISALSLAIAEPDVSEILQWAAAARRLHGFSWRALVDWRHLQEVATSRRFTKFIQEEDAEANVVETAFDSGEIAL